MGLDIHSANLVLYLNKKKLFTRKESVLDFGDQNLALDREEYNLFFEKSFSIDGDLKNEINKSKNYLSSSLFWNLLGFKKNDRVDMFFQKRDKKLDPVNKKIVHDLNYTLDNKIRGYDLVTDFGNNEHAFNISNTYEAMHNACNKNGLIVIQQQLIFSNGFYNMTNDFFENLAAHNNYEICFSRLSFYYHDRVEFYDVDTNFIRKCDITNIDTILMTYVFRKTNEKNFRIPYQRITPSNSKKIGLYKLNLKTKNYPFERDYVFLDLNKIKAADLIKNIVIRFLKKIKLI